MTYIVIALTILSFITVIILLRNTSSKTKSIPSSIKLEERLKKIVALSANEIDSTEDTPIDFGFKISWLAIKTTDQTKVANSLGAKTTHTCNWNSGVNLAYSGKASFITPPIDGWILVISFNPIPDHKNQIEKVESTLINLSKTFDEVQLFSTHRVVEFHCWVKVINGKIIREYSYLGESGENIIVKGVPTEVEKGIKLVNTFSPESTSKDYWSQSDLVIPSEDFVIKVASSWSIDPTTLSDRKDITGIGLTFN